MRRLLAVLLALTLPRLAAAQTTSYAFVPALGTNVVTVVDTSTGIALGTVPTGSNPLAAAASPDGRWVYVANQSSLSVTVIDAVSRTVATTIPTTGMQPFGVAFTPDGRKAFVTQQSPARFGVIDVTTHTFLGPPADLPGAGIGRTVAIAPDGATAWITTDGALYPVDTATRAVGSAIAVPGFHVGIAITPDGVTAFLGDSAGVQVVDLVNRVVMPPIAFADTRNLAVTPDGRYLYAVNSTVGTVTVVDTALRTVVTTIVLGGSPIGVAFTPTGDRAYVTDAGGTVTVVDVATHTPAGTIPVTAITTGYGGGFLGPLVIVPPGGPFEANNDEAGLTAAGFHRFVPFAGGTMRTTAGLLTDRTFSLLAPGGTIDTNGQNAALIGGLTGPGLLTKAGEGGLGLYAPMNHGGTVLSAGALYVMDPHLPPVSMTGGYLYAMTSSMGNIGATGGTLLPGGSGPGILQAGAVTLGAGSTLSISVHGPDGAGAPAGHDQLQASGLTLTGGALSVVPYFVPALGASFTIATNATGTFANQPEGSRITFGTFQLVISYVGGTGHDVTLTRVNMAPVVTPPLPQQGLQNTPKGPIAFTVSDPDGDPAALVVTATSSNQAIVPDAGIALGGSGGSRTVTVTPRFGAQGGADITLTASDGLNTGSATFQYIAAYGTYMLAEGATGSFFDTDILIANPNTDPAPISIHFMTADGPPIVLTRTLAPTSRTTVAADDVPGLEAASFSTVVTSHSGLPLVVERTMRWGEGGYGAHTEKASAGPGPVWVFAEGAQGYFSTYVLLSNPQPAANVVRVFFLLESQAFVMREYTMPAYSRLTVDASAIPELRDQAFGIVVNFDAPGAAERAMYFGTTPVWSGGDASAGSPGVAFRWLLAEGATGSYFTTFVLLANPMNDPADVTLTYLPAAGAPVVRQITVPPGSRVTRNIATEDPSLANTAVATVVQSSVPIMAERSQYWGAPEWIEAHNSAGLPFAYTKWGLAEGRVGGPDSAQTYILIANPGTVAATVTVTFLRESGSPIVKTFTVAPQSRFNVAVTGPGSQVPELMNERFGAVVTSTQPIGVERSMYSNAGGIMWAAGTNATGTPLP